MKSMSKASANIVPQVNIQFVVDRADFEQAQVVLHREFVEKKDA